MAINKILMKFEMRMESTRINVRASLRSIRFILSYIVKLFPVLKLIKIEKRHLSLSFNSRRILFQELRIDFSNHDNTF